MIKGTWTESRIHCMRRPLGLVVELRRLLVHMNSGVRPMEVRMATPEDTDVLGTLSIGVSCVVAKSIDTCTSRQTHSIVIQIHGQLRPRPWRRIR